MPAPTSAPPSRPRRVAVGAGLLAAGLLGGFAVRAEAPLDLLRSAFAVMLQRYVEPVAAERVVERGIRTMLKELDPHSTYLTAAQMQRVREEFNAGFEGIGITFERLPGPPDTVAVQSVLPGGPSETVGLQTGDRLLRADGVSLLGLPDSLVVARLRGPGGSPLALDVLRHGERAPRTLTITRGRIPLNSVESAYRLDRQTGYVRLVRFSRTTADEVREALAGLQLQGVTRAVLDLRGNGGGYLDQAVKVSDLFLPAGKLVVSQKGREGRNTQDFRTSDSNAFEGLPLIVLVDGSSASASEIVAGALQDHDRALLVGRRTFGKGLVQQQRELSDGSAVRVTIARFFTPTGRLIQTPYERGQTPETYYASKRARQTLDRSMRLEEMLSQVPDSLKRRTPAGRVVIGGGGILPDVLVTDTLGAAAAAVLRQGLLDRYARTWVQANLAATRRRYASADAFSQGFSLPAADLEAFLAMAARSLHDPATPEATWRARLNAERDDLDALLVGRIAARLYDRNASIQRYNRRDRTLQEALQHWPEAQTLAR